MSQSPTIGNPNILSLLKSFKPIGRPKLSHTMNLNSSSSTDSVSEGSPILRNPFPIMISDSESEKEVNIHEDSDNDCIIVDESGSKNNLEDSNFMVKNKRMNDDNSMKNLPAGKNNTETLQHIHVISDSDDEPLKVIKRKKKNSTKTSKKKKPRESNFSNNSVEKNEEYSSDDSTLNCKIKLRNKVIDFLNTSSETEFNTIPIMNAKKAQIIISNRPYSSWDKTVEVFNLTKGINCSLLNTIRDVIDAKEIVFKLMKKCEELASEIEHKISSSEILVSRAPTLLNPAFQLSSYQLLGLNWLALMRSKSLNSILADEMGLGKTIQVIAFLAYLKENDIVVENYPHLIVVPSSTLDNWYDEFQRWCPSMNVVIYHGSQEERKELRTMWYSKEGFGNLDVILTTYACAISTREERKMFQTKEFNYIIFDEAHFLKNMNTRRYEALIQFNGNFKILLTGTPLQNNVLELMSLLIFLMPSLFNGKVDHIKTLFSKCSKNINDNASNFEKEKLNQAKRIIEPFMLRRLKEDVLNDLPKKTVSMEKCPLLPDQRMKYDEIMEEFKIVAASKETNNYYMSYFMMLRKIANHPLLLRYQFTEDKLEKISNILAEDKLYKGTNSDHIKEDLIWKSDYELYQLCQEMDSLRDLQFNLPDELFCSGKLNFLKSKLLSLKKEGHRVLIFSQFILMLDILQEFCRINSFSYLRLDGSTATTERQEMIDLFNLDESIFLFLLSTKAGGLGINLTAADTVIIHDIDFNPYNDKQAEDRCHRVGQKKCVQVIKLISENTVEEGMYKSSIDKLCLEKQITSTRGKNISESKTVLQLLKETLGMH